MRFSIVSEKALMLILWSGSSPMNEPSRSANVGDSPIAISIPQWTTTVYMLHSKIRKRYRGPMNHLGPHEAGAGISPDVRVADRRRLTTSTRLTSGERAVVDALSRLVGVPVSVIVRELVVPAARRRLAELAGEMEGG